MNFRPHVFVLAVYPSAQGLAYVIFESPFSPIDWGMKEARGIRKYETGLALVSSLLARYQPGVLVLQDTSLQGTHRTARIRHLNADIDQLARNAGVETISFSRAEVMRIFASVGAVDKRSLAETIAKHVPVFERYLPPARRAWMTEDARMALFDAAALGLTFFQSPLGKGVEVA